MESDFRVMRLKVGSAGHSGGDGASPFGVSRRRDPLPPLPPDGLSGPMERFTIFSRRSSPPIANGRRFHSETSMLDQSQRGYAVNESNWLDLLSLDDPRSASPPPSRDPRRFSDILNVPEEILASKGAIHRDYRDYEGEQSALCVI